MKLIFIALSLLAVARCQSRISERTAANRKAIAETIATYSTAKNKVAKELTTLQESTKNIQAAVQSLKASIPDNVLLDRFYEGYSRQLYASEEMSKFDPFVTTIIKNAILDYGSRAATVFSECYTNDVIGKLAAVTDSVPARLAQLDKEEAAFKAELDFCSGKPVILSGTTNVCIATVISKYPYPKAQSNGLSTIESMNEVFACLEKATTEIRRVGNAGINVYRRLFTPENQYLLVKDFQSDNTPPIAFPDASQLLPVSASFMSQLNPAKDSVALALSVQAQASASKVISFDSAKDWLSPQIKVLTDYVNDTEASAAILETPCYTAAKTFLHFGIKNKSLNLVNCITSVKEPPSILLLNNADNAAKEIEAKENLAWSSVDCSKILTNVFNPIAMDRCLSQAKTDTAQRLSTIKLQMQAAAADSTDVLVQVQRCKCTAETELHRESRAELYNLQQCLMKISKVRVEVPKEACIVNSCA